MQTGDDNRQQRRMATSLLILLPFRLWSLPLRMASTLQLSLTPSMSCTPSFHLSLLDALASESMPTHSLFPLKTSITSYLVFSFLMSLHYIFMVCSSSLLVFLSLSSAFLCSQCSFLLYFFLFPVIYCFHVMWLSRGLLTDHVFL